VIESKFRARDERPEKFPAALDGTVGMLLEKRTEQGALLVVGRT
jgi:hypothetical protein